MIMKIKRWFGLAFLVTMILSNISVNAQEFQTDTQTEFEMKGKNIGELVSRYTNFGESIILYRKSEMLWAIDDLYWHSNDAFFLLLYDLIYNEPFVYKSEPLEFANNDFDEDISESNFYDMQIEKSIRKQQMVDEGYILQEELDLYPITKNDLARILYRIYKDALPFEESVAYVDTKSVEVRWAAERNIPFFLNRSGYEIYPNQSLHNTSQYIECLNYAYLYFPNPITRKYSDVIISEEDAQFVVLRYGKVEVKDIVNYIDHIREEVKKPRLGYWIKDVYNNPEIAISAKKYLNNWKTSDLKELHSKLKENYNLLSYQDDLDYIGFMCKYFKDPK